MSKTLIVDIDRQGIVKIDAVGFKGKACEKATAFIEQALGNVAKRSTKPEYNAPVTLAQQLSVGR